MTGLKSQVALTRYVFTMQPKYEFEHALDYVKLSQNRAKLSRKKKKLKCEHKNA